MQASKTSATRTATLLLYAVLPAILPACREPAGSPAPPPFVENKSDLTTEKAQPGTADTPAEPVVWPVEVDDPDRWLRVESIRKGAAGAWATGSFNRKRNKLDLHTHGVRAFSIDTGRVPINWQRIVILGIDGSNSELRRRDFQIYHFELTDHGQWVVLEP